MLSLALVLLSGPLDQAATRPFALSTAGDEPVTNVQVARPDDATQRFLSGRCEALLHRVGPSNQSTVVTRSTALSVVPLAGGPRVRMYHLLERTIDGCRVPVIAVDHLPEADRAVGRNLGDNVIQR